MSNPKEPLPGTITERVLAAYQAGTSRDAMPRRLGLRAQQVDNAISHLRARGYDIPRRSTARLTHNRPPAPAPTSEIITASTAARRERITQLKQQGLDFAQVAAAIFGERPIKMPEGTIFPNARAAGIAWGVSEETVLSWVSQGTARFARPSELDPNAVPANIWARTSAKKAKKLRPSRAKPQSRFGRPKGGWPVKINGKLYDNAGKAASALRLSRKAIEGRVRRGAAAYVTTDQEQPT